MGFISLISIYNDGAGELIYNPIEFTDKIYRIACNANKPGAFGVGYHANCVNYQKVRHASDTTIYVHAGNCITDMNSYSDDVEALLNRNPEFFDELLDILDLHNKRLKKMRIQNKLKTKQNAL
jgi:hypothetical protein